MLKSASPLPWKINPYDSRNILIDGRFIGDFDRPADAAYATKAANMHERLVQAVKDLATADIINTEYIAALLKEADDET